MIHSGVTSQDLCRMLKRTRCPEPCASLLSLLLGSAISRMDGLSVMTKTSEGKAGRDHGRSQIKSFGFPVSLQDRRADGVPDSSLSCLSDHGTNRLEIADQGRQHCQRRVTAVLTASADCGESSAAQARLDAIEPMPLTICDPGVASFDGDAGRNRFPAFISRRRSCADQSDAGHHQCRGVRVSGHDGYAHAGRTRGPGQIPWQCARHPQGRDVAVCHQHHAPATHILPKPDILPPW